jgi:hypothetical protein
VWPEARLLDPSLERQLAREHHLEPTADGDDQAGQRAERRRRQRLRLVQEEDDGAAHARVGGDRGAKVGEAARRRDVGERMAEAPADELDELVEFEAGMEDRQRAEARGRLGLELAEEERLSRPRLADEAEEPAALGEPAGESGAGDLVAPVREDPAGVGGGPERGLGEAEELEVRRRVAQKVPSTPTLGMMVSLRSPASLTA